LPAEEGAAEDAVAEDAVREEAAAEEAAADPVPAEEEPAEEAPAEEAPTEAAPAEPPRKRGRRTDAEFQRQLEESRRAPGAWLLYWLGFNPEGIHAQDGDPKIVRRGKNLLFVKKKKKKRAKE
jgi:hypothetical protein